MGFGPLRRLMPSGYHDGIVIGCPAGTLSKMWGNRYFQRFLLRDESLMQINMTP